MLTLICNTYNINQKRKFDYYQNRQDGLDTIISFIIVDLKSPLYNTLINEFIPQRQLIGIFLIEQYVFYPINKSSFPYLISYLIKLKRYYTKQINLIKVEQIFIRLKSTIKKYLINVLKFRPKRIIGENSPKTVNASYMNVKP